MAELWIAIKPFILTTLIPGLLTLLWEHFLAKQKRLPEVNSTISLTGLILKHVVAKGAQLIGGKKS